MDTSTTEAVTTFLPFIIIPLAIAIVAAFFLRRKKVPVSSNLIKPKNAITIIGQMTIMGAVVGLVTGFLFPYNPYTLYLIYFNLTGFKRGDVCGGLECVPVFVMSSIIFWTIIFIVIALWRAKKMQTQTNVPR